MIRDLDDDERELVLELLEQDLRIYKARAAMDGTIWQKPAKRRVMLIKRLLATLDPTGPIP